VHYHWSWTSLWDYRFLILRGWGITVLVSAGALILSIALGFLLMLGQRCPWLPVKMFCRGYVEIIRGTPLLVQLLIGYYIVANALRINDPLPVGMVLLASFESAYLAEIFRGALESIGATQIEAARAVGFDRVQIYRHVILPQALRRALPGTAGEMISLIKNSSLLSVIGIEELTQTIKTANANAYTALEGFIPLALMYLALTLPLSWWARRLEVRFKFET
jgi:polar amino acid transport system permease protein